MGTYGPEGASGATGYVSVTDVVADLVRGARRWTIQASATPPEIVKQKQ
jgi:hypothetical protein